MDTQEVADRLTSLKICSTIKQLADQVKTDNRIEYIRFCVLLALEAVRMRYTMDYEKCCCDLTEQKRLVATVISVYLQAWMKSDQKAGQNLNAFYNYGYCSKTRRRNRNSVDQGKLPFYYSREALVRQKQKYQTIIEKNIIEQAKVENLCYGSDKDTKKPKQQQDYASKLSWETLCLLDKLSEGKLEILSYLIKREEIFKKGLHRTSNEHLHKCYQDYYDLYRRLDPQNKEAHAITDIEYVSTAIMLQEMEYSYRFHAAALLAKEMVGRVPPFRFDAHKEDLLLFWGRFANAGGVKRTIINGNPDLVFEYRSRDILSYSDKIQYLCDCGENHSNCHSTFPQRVASNIILEREILLLLLNIIPPKKMPSWEEKDYHHARLFFEKEYPIYQVYLQACGENGALNMGDMVHKRENDTAYDMIRDFFKWMIASQGEDKYRPEAPGRKHIIGEMKEFTSKRYKPTRDKRGRPPKNSGDGDLK